LYNLYNVETVRQRNHELDMDEFTALMEEARADFFRVQSSQTDDK